MEIIYACEEHIDQAMDEVINEKETFPVMNEATEKKCSYCNKEAKYEILVQIKMLNYFLKQALDKEIITKKKFLSYGNHLLEIHNMVNSWCGYEKSE